jgi:hypothetical protein
MCLRCQFDFVKVAIIFAIAIVPIPALAGLSPRAAELAANGGEYADHGRRIAAEGTMPLYRAVKAGELADINTTGVFRNLGSAEGKYFSTTAEGATSYARQAYRAWPGEGPYTLVRTEISRGLLTPEMAAVVDRGIPTLVVPNALLPGLRPLVLNYFPIFW